MRQILQMKWKLSDTLGCYDERVKRAKYSALSTQIYTETTDKDGIHTVFHRLKFAVTHITQIIDTLHEMGWIMAPRLQNPPQQNAVKDLREGTKANTTIPHEYVKSRIMRYVDIPNRTRYLMRCYKYFPRYDTLEPAQHIPTPLLRRNWSSLASQNQSTKRNYATGRQTDCRKATPIMGNTKRDWGFQK